MLDSYLTKNSEQSDAFNKAIDNSNEAVKNYDRTLKALSKLDPGLIFSSQGVTAQANAFKELADNLSIVREKFQELDKATTGWDRFWDGVFGKSQGQKFAEAAVSNISKIIAAVNDPKQREQLAQKVNEVLGTKGTTGLEWIEALKKGGPEAIALVKQIEEAIKPLSTQQSIAASRSKEFDEQLKKLTESYKAFAFSAVEKSPMTTLGNDMVTFAVKTVGALEDTENGLANMLNLMNSSKEIGMFSTETFTQLLKMKTEVEALNNAHGETRIKLQAVRQEEAALRLEYEQVYKRTGGITRSQASMQAGLTGSSKPLQDALELEQASIKLNDKLAERQKLQKKDTEEIQKIAQLMSAPVFGKAVAESFTIGANLVSQSIQLAFSKANADLQKGILANISDLPGTAALQRSAEQQDFNVQRLQLNVQQQMLKAQYLMIAAQNQTTAAVTLEKAKTEEAGRDLSGPSRGMRSDNPLNLEAAQRSSDLATQFSNMLAGDGKGAQALINSLIKEINTLAKSGGLDPTKVANLQQMLNASQSFMGISGKLAGIQTGETLSDLKEKIGLDKEKQKIQEQINNLIKTKAQSQLSALDIIQQQNEFLTVQQTQQKNNLQVEINAIDYATKLLGITQEEQKFEKSVQELKKAGKDTTQLEALTGESLAQKRLQAYLEYATLQEKTVAQGALATNKALEEERKSREKIKRIVEDTQAQLNRAYTEEKSIILSNQSKYERANEERIAGQKYSNELLKIADETREKTIALDRAWEDKKAEIAAKRGRTALGEAGDEARARLKAEEEAEEDKYKRLTAAEKRLADAKREGARIDKELAESKYREQEALRVLKLTELEQELINIRARGRLEVEELDLQYYTNSEKFSQQELANLKYRLEALKLEQDLKEKTQSSELSYLKEKRRLEGELERVDPEDISAITQILNELNLLKTKRDFETGTYREIYAAKKRLLELDASLTERQKAYGDVFKKTFEGMADAIVEFVKTGKLDFKSLIDSMLSDLLRFELRQQTLALYQSARPGLMNFFGGGGSGPSTFVNDAGGLEVAGSLGFAKGGAFDYGIERFAMGGAFTNKIINSPTLFKFAQGTGLMGEAGPEAIMPLKRDGQGNLGVRSASPKTEVVINNYGSEQATATETTDSQGNRRIEVAIGDMTAGEMSRSGSASQRSLRNTYGLQPQLIRR
jgi:phage-related minor tail protein